MKYVRILITAPVPDASHELGHEAIVVTRDPAKAIVAQLTALGLPDAEETRELITKHPTKTAIPSAQ